MSKEFDADFLPNDMGTVFLERHDDGSVVIRVRSPEAKSYSFVRLTWEEWTDLRSLNLPVPEPEINF